MGDLSERHPELHKLAFGGLESEEASVPEQPLTVDEVAELMRVSSKTVMRAIASGQLEASQVTQGRGGWRIRPQAIDAWMDSRSNRTLPERTLAEVRRVETQSPAPRRPSRAPRSGGSGTLVA